MDFTQISHFDEVHFDKKLPHVMRSERFNENLPVKSIFDDRLICLWILYLTCQRAHIYYLSNKTGSIEHIEIWPSYGQIH